MPAKLTQAVYIVNDVDSVWFAENQSPYCLTDGIDRLCRNVGKKLPFFAAYNSTRAQISFTQRQKPEITQSSTDLPDDKEQRYSLSL